MHFGSDFAPQITHSSIADAFSWLDFQMISVTVKFSLMLVPYPEVLFSVQKCCKALKVEGLSRQLKQFKYLDNLHT